MTRSLLLTAAALLLLDCAAAPLVRHKPTTPVEGWGVAVMPFSIDYPSSDAESYSRSLAVAEHLARTTDKLVYGPAEFSVSAPDQDDLRKATDLLRRVHYTEARTPETFLALRLSARQSMHLGPEDRSAKVNVIVRAEFLSLARPGVLASVEGRIPMDLDSHSEGADTWPGLTKLTQTLVDALVETVGWKPVSRPPTHGLTFITAPRPALDFHPPTTSEKPLLAIEREARLNTAVQAVDPTASVARRATYQEEPWGLMVDGVSERSAEAHLLRDDFLIDANGDPLYGEYVLMRQLRDGPVRLRLKRGGVVMGAEISP